MNIAIVGGGLTGLTAGYKLGKLGHKVTIYEKEPFVGGLAHGFTPPGWQWSLEAFYHHIFSNDYAIIDLAHEIGCDTDLFFSNPVTATLLPNSSKLHRLDSPASLLRFSPLSPLARIQTGMMLAFLKANPFWQPMEGITAETFIRAVGGTAGWRMLWEPLLYGKFGPYADKVAASWFWARIKKRTPSLGYFRGGFQKIAETLAKKIKDQGGTINIGVTIKQSDISTDTYDKVLLTIPSFQTSIPHLWAQTLILETKEPILKDVYWLNVNDRSFPFLSMVAHTNFIDKKNYGGNHITYLGNYLPDGHEYLKMDKNQLIKIFMPFIQRINPSLILNHESLINSYLFTAPNAQPVHTLHYSRQAPKLETSIPGIYLANMDSIYPWDRGTNYAVELGLRAAERISHSR
jgi:protoporphyrinogen oxidase